MEQYNRGISAIRPEENMRPKLIVSVLVAFVFILYAVPLSSAEPTDACALLTQSRLSTVAGVYIGAGSPI